MQRVAHRGKPPAGRRGAAEAARRLVARLASRGLTLACAESCTGGLLSGRVTAVPGASAVFHGGVVAYANAIKRHLLGVPAATLEARGAVSAQTAREMAAGACKRLRADVGIATTGIAGPSGGTPTKPVGLVYVAVRTPRGDVVRRHVFEGGRARIRAQAVEAALRLALSRLALAAILALPARTALHAQTLNVDRFSGGTFSGSFGVDVNPPPPAGDRSPLEMASLPGACRPGGFLLKRDEATSYGPFVYREGARIGSAAAAYLLHVADPETFSLESLADGSLIGPLAYREGTDIPFPGASLRLVRLPGRLVGRCVHEDIAPGASPVLALARDNPTTRQALYELRAGLSAIAARLRLETSDVAFAGVPTVVGPTGVRRTPTVSRSLRDREDARRAADSSAALHLERFMREHMPVKIQAGADGAFSSPNLPPGKYVFCALLRVRDRDSTVAARSRVAAWWSTFSIDVYEWMEFDLNAGNAGSWSDVFPRRDR